MSTSIFDKMNLRPQERRLVVIVGLVIFVLLNMWFVWPFFNDWGTTREAIAKNRDTLERYKREISQKPKYEALQRELEATGSQMLQSENDLQRIIQTQIAASAIQVVRGPVPISTTGKTNQFYQEIGVSLEFTSGGREIVDFLVGVAAQNAMIRVREMRLSPEPSQQRLRGTLVFVGNFQQKSSTNAPSRNVAAAAPPKKK
jgi:Tfp pilus assembly protein PilO